MKVNSSALEKLCNEYDDMVFPKDGTKKEYGNAVLLGSWTLSAYAKNLKGVDLGKEIDRKTGDIDLYVLDEETVNALDLMDDPDVNYNECWQPFREMESDPDGKFEFFTSCPFEDEITNKLFDYLKEEQNLDSLSFSEKIKIPKPWVWLGLKISALEQSKKEKHRHDIIYFKGLVGDNKMKEYINELASKDKSFKKLKSIYQTMLQEELPDSRIDDF